MNTRYTAAEVADLLVRMDARALVFSGRLAAVVAEALSLLPEPLRLVVHAGAVPDGFGLPGALRTERRWRRLRCCWRRTSPHRRTTW